MSGALAPQQVVVFTVGGQEHALPVERVREIIRHAEPRSVGAREPWVRGVIALRGRIVRVHDLAVRLGLPPASAATAHIVLVEAAGEVAGIVVDGVTEVLTLDAARIEPSPEGGTVAGVARHGDRLIVLLDADGILDRRQDPGPAGPGPAPAPVAPVAA